MADTTHLITSFVFFIKVFQTYATYMPNCHMASDQVNEQVRKLRLNMQSPKMLGKATTESSVVRGIGRVLLEELAFILFTI
jgi:hypothetical protein